ncbi:unnamed protein product [Linum trigynum]|uniref:Cystatin domain-containing protein n=1 Tax=Linum trigynum TaxID=586398 RepID=A0AAV2D165_9ROSI
MKAISFLITIATLSFFLSDATATGGWRPIKNVNDEHVLEIAEFAVKTYSWQIGRSLELITVRRGIVQVVAGGKSYELVLTASPPHLDLAPVQYKAVVYENVFHVKKLVYFRPSYFTSSEATTKN